MIVGLILAAGASGRMRGADKLLEPVDAQPLLTRQVNVMQAVCPKVYVTLPPAPHPRYACINTAHPVPVASPEKGMSESLKTGLRAVPADCTHVLLMLADLPELEADDLRSVLRVAETDEDALIWRGASEAGRPGHPVLIDRALFAEIEELEGDVGAASLFKRYKDRLRLVPLPGERAITDLDTPEAWAAWRAARQSSG